MVIISPLFIYRSVGQSIRDPVTGSSLAIKQPLSAHGTDLGQELSKRLAKVGAVADIEIQASITTRRSERFLRAKIYILEHFRLFSETFVVSNEIPNLPELS